MPIHGHIEAIFEGWTEVYPALKIDERLRYDCRKGVFIGAFAVLQFIKKTPNRHLDAILKEISDEVDAKMREFKSVNIRMNGG